MFHLSHISERGFWDVLDVSGKPIIASHSNCKMLCDHSRNLSDEQIKAVGGNGGAIAVTFVPGFIDKDAPSLPRLLDHLEHIRGPQTSLQISMVPIMSILSTSLSFPLRSEVNPEPITTALRTFDDNHNDNCRPKE